VLIGLAATLLVLGGVALGDRGVTALEWSVYDRWVRTRASAPVSPALLIVARDPASEARFGVGAWDRAVLARVITSLSRAGAVEIGVDVALGQPSAPGRGGAASDALLSQATAEAANVVYAITLEPARPRAPAEPGATAGSGARVHSSWSVLSESAPPLLEVRPLAAPLPGLAKYAKGVGHTLTWADADGVVRKVPLMVRLEDHAVPAFGLALASALKAPDVVAPEPRPASQRSPLRIPIDGRQRTLLAYVPAKLDTGLKVVPFVDVWAALEQRQAGPLRNLVDGKVVLVLTEPTHGLHLTPIGPMSEVMIQAHLLNTVLTRRWLSETPAVWACLAAFALSSLVAWLALALRWWRALIGAAVLGLGYVAGVPLCLSLFGLVLPLLLPSGAVVVACAGAFGRNLLGSVGRLRHVEGEVEGMRETLVRRESAVEALEEDLEAARAAMARSTGAERELLLAADGLRQQLAEARAQEEQARSRLGDVERELRAADRRPTQLDDTEQERLRRECEEVGIITRDPAMLALFRDLEKAARSSLPILIVGEPGTGKELFARAAHRLSARAGGPFVAVNMAAIPGELFESELFGHVKGSFTGAVGERKGYFEQADRVTIFLDEIGELRAEHQSKLLRVLQEKSFYRVGATRSTAVDVRVVAASNRDLERGIVAGWFREDLYFRLKGLVLRLPPLRERRQDIAPLAASFLEEAAAESERRVGASEAALLALEGHDWPGNVRELQHCLRQAVALAERAVLAPEDLRLSPAGDAQAADATGDAAVLDCLRMHGFDMQATARALGWDRSTVTQRLKGLGFRALVDADGDRRKAALALAGGPGLGRTVELKLGEYHEHLLRAVEGFDSADAAVAACRRRFKNLPERHFRSLEFLVRQHFERRPPPTRA
jgi:DNA-binding NtrC family response regulator/CHASE2 domain-containing sensor protein